HNFRHYLKGSEVVQKKYFYVLRPLLAIKWLDADLGPVPMEFSKLVDAVVSDAFVRRAIDDLLSLKRKGVEHDRAPANPVLSKFIDVELRAAEERLAIKRPRERPSDLLNVFFQTTLARVWDADAARPVRGGVPR